MGEKVIGYTTETKVGRKGTMLTKILPIARRARPISCLANGACARLQTVRHGSKAYDADRNESIARRTTLDDMPVPSGSWQELNGKDNTRWNLELAANLLLLGGVIFLMNKMNCFQCFELYLQRYRKPEISSHVDPEW